MSDAKLLRGQIRQIVKELFPNMVTDELVTALHKRLVAQVDARLDSIDKYMKSRLDAVDERWKEVQSYVVRNTK